METGFWTQVSGSLSKSDCEERIWDHVAIERIGQRSPSGRGGRDVEPQDNCEGENDLGEFP